MNKFKRSCRSSAWASQQVVAVDEHWEQTLPALTVTASMNCSLHDDVPTTNDMFAFRSSLSTVLYRYTY